MISAHEEEGDPSLALPPQAPLQATFPREVRACLRLGMPLALGELGWMSTYIVDALMIGRLPHSALPIAASSLGNAIFSGIVFFAIYMLNGLETIVAQAAGRGDRSECVRILMQSMWIVVLGIPFVVGGTLLGVALLPVCGVGPELTHETSMYLHALLWSTAPLMLYMALRRFLQSVNRVVSISLSLLTAGVMNWLFDWLLIFGHLRAGHWHVPAMGFVGSGWGTVLVRCWMLVVLLPATFRAFREVEVWPRLTMLRPDALRLKALLAIGWPSGLEYSLELGITTYLSVLCARFGATLLAAQQVTTDLNAFVYMVPLGLSYSALIRTGQAAGRNDLPWVKRATNATLLLTQGYALVASVVFIALSPRLCALYTNDPQVVSAAAPLLRLCSLQLVGDVAFVIHASAFTGLGDTRTPLWVSIVCNWMFGMPLAYVLAFPMHYSLLGLRVGCALASVSSGIVMTAMWRRRVRAEDKSKAPLALPMLTPVRVP